jgi:hypothetical protein
VHQSPLGGRYPIPSHCGSAESMAEALRVMSDDGPLTRLVATEMLKGYPALLSHYINRTFTHANAAHSIDLYGVF